MGDDEDVCWHCGDCLIGVTRPRCEQCPEECDVEDCDAPGCNGETLTRYDAALARAEKAEREIASWRRVTERLEREKRELRDARASFRQERDEARAECARLEEKVEQLKHDMNTGERRSLLSSARIATLEEALTNLERETSRSLAIEQPPGPKQLKHWSECAREALAKR